ncbi:MAG: phosphohydrolase [Rhodoferax sp.]|uniref:HD-GYP domain-containing protein n=1 Tax=Rhodoferax sp. TaxID=50421 RepID=UPI002603C686|nr:HD domain-containing phosphohydrolase [Rhodoferax sp.]MDD2881155.1 phosphohydrolase [Rhodoferax sp.]
MKFIRLPRAKVLLGTPLTWNVRDEAGNLLLSKGHVVSTESQLDQLLQRGAFVDVEEARLQAQTEAPVQIKQMVAPPNLFGLWGKTAEALRTLFSQLEHKTDFGSQLDEFARHILKLLDSNMDIGIFRAVRQENQPLFYYGYTHAIHTAVMCVLLSRHLRWAPAQVTSLLKAALTMNLSISDLQGQMAAQDVPMKDRQRADIQAHPQKAVDLLEKLGVTDADWLTAVLQHHERADGSGYPSHCTAVSDMAIALRVCDVLMAKISPRTLRAALSPQDAVRQLYREDNGGPISTAIIKEFGIYPPGNFVKLASGELGIVVQRTGNAKAPVVAVITDTAGRPVSRTVRRDTAQAEFAITGTHSDLALLKRLPPERLYGFSNLPGTP